MYARFTLSFRDVEELLLERGVDASYETVRRWVLKFGAKLSIKVAGDSGLQVVADPAALADVGQHLEKRNYTSDSGPTDADGHHIRSGWVARVPISLTPTSPWDIGGNRYPLNVTGSYVSASGGQDQTLSAGGGIEAQVPYALVEMAAAASVLPLLCLGAALVRWTRTR